MIKLRFDPLIPLPLLQFLLAAGVLLLGYALWRRARGAGLRAATIAVGLLFLSGPMLDRETRRVLPDIGLLVVDQTPSMRVGDRQAVADKAAQTLTEEARRLPDLDWRTVSVPAADPRAGDNGTRLFATIDRAMAGIPADRLAGIVAITDGQVHDVPVKPLSAPLHVLIPAEGEQTDRRIRVLEAPSFGLIGQPATLKIAVDDLGVSAGSGPTDADIVIRHDGAPPRSARVRIGQPVTLSLPISKPGPTVVDLSVVPLAGEASTLNNHATIVVNGVQDRLRVLLLSGLPHPGEPVWRHMLKADPSVDLVHVTILRLPSTNDHTPENELALVSFPSRELFVDKINSFDLIILDRFPHRGLLPDAYLANIANYVQNGGALLMSVGPEFAGATSLADSPLSTILPATPTGGDESVIEGGFRPHISAIGERHPVTQGLPGGDGSWGSWYRYIQASGGHGQTVMTAPNGNPLLMLDRVGQGRVALLLSDQIWLWARGHQGGGPAAELLRRVAHWLMKQPALEEESLTASIVDGRLTISRRSLSDGAPPPIRVTPPDGAAATVSLTENGPGQAKATIDAEQPGLWSVTDGTHTAYAAAMPLDPTEIADLRATATILQKQATQSGGSVHWLKQTGAPEIRLTSDSDTVGGSNWIGLKQNHAARVTGLISTDLLPTPLALLLMGSLMIIAWWREGYRDRSSRRPPP